MLRTHARIRSATGQLCIGAAGNRQALEPHLPYCQSQPPTRYSLPFAPHYRTGIAEAVRLPATVEKMGAAVIVSQHSLSFTHKTNCYEPYQRTTESACTPPAQPRD